MALLLLLERVGDCVGAADARLWDAAAEFEPRDAGPSYGAILPRVDGLGPVGVVSAGVVRALPLPRFWP